jgi:hypothetical protein
MIYYHFGILSLLVNFPFYTFDTPHTNKRFCIECEFELSRKWNEEHKNDIKENKRKWDEAHSTIRVK